MADEVEFYPKTLGHSKREICRWINDRLADDMWEKELPGDVKAREEDLTDERAQKFINEWYDIFMDCVEYGVESVCEAQEELLEELAVQICK
jgi:hypothetical protein